MPAAERMAVAGVDLEILRRGAGRPVLLLHGFAPLAADTAFVDGLAAHTEVIVPTHPGFGTSTRPADFDSVYDLVHLYVALLARMPYDRVTVVGLSFGGWLAAELAVACPRRLDKLVLVDAVGIKVSDRETPDILDVFNTAPAEVRRRTWHDPRSAPDFDEMSDEALVAHVRNRDALCLYAWHPYLYNPSLARWLGTIEVPALVVWGASDRIVTPAYGRAYAARIPGARFELIEGAGHHPEIEQPEILVERMLAFLKE